MVPSCQSRDPEDLHRPTLMTPVLYRGCICPPHPIGMLENRAQLGAQALGSILECEKLNDLKIISEYGRMPRPACIKLSAQKTCILNKQGVVCFRTMSQYAQEWHSCIYTNEELIG